MIIKLFLSWLSKQEIIFYHVNIVNLTILIFSLDARLVE
jgi:hypothetical protein